MNTLSRSHFELFGLAESFAIDCQVLDSAFRRVQSAVHPDRFGGGTDTDRRIAMQLATQANEAYRTLRSPLLRAEYLCSLHDADPQVHSNTAMPGQFLQLQMQWREQLEDLREQSLEGGRKTLTGLR
ncbi:MAG: Fe-S protein assembly co-chaperone HscB, partial [Quisquiliibacterium sp.]